MAYLQTLYSGSSGNSTLICFDDIKILIDMGCSCRKTINILYDLGVSISEIKAILITHEHVDHIGGLNTFLKKYHIPVYGLGECLDYIEMKSYVPTGTELVSVTPDESFDISGIKITPFATQHDSLGCCGYRLECGESNVAVATDIGKVTEKVYSYLEGCEVVALESNYDEGSLMVGPYPYQLKQRIRSDYGHLSNTDCAAVGVRLAKHGTRAMTLMHLSDENNTPSLAEMTFLGFLDNYGIEGMAVKAAPRNAPGERYEF